MRLPQIYGEEVFFEKRCQTVPNEQQVLQIGIAIDRSIDELFPQIYTRAMQSSGRSVPCLLLGFGLFSLYLLFSSLNMRERLPTLSIENAGANLVEILSKLRRFGKGSFRLTFSER